MKITSNALQMRHEAVPSLQRGWYHCRQGCCDCRRVFRVQGIFEGSRADKALTGLPGAAG